MISALALLSAMNPAQDRPRVDLPNRNLPKFEPVVNLTPSSSVTHDSFARFSKDGSMIVFQRSTPAGNSIWRMSSTGKNAEVIGGGKQPHLSPDGTKVIYTDDGNGDDLRIFTVPTSGGTRSQIMIPRVNDGAGVETFQSPVWSPDGTKIAYVRIRVLDYDIFVANADGTGQRRLTSGQGRNILPSWSPSGERIAFASDRDSTPGHQQIFGKMQIYVMEANGANQTRITSFESGATSPCWSPDGTRLAYSGNVNGISDIFVMNYNGSNIRNITNSPEKDLRPSWSPNGRAIIYDTLFEGRLSGRSIRRNSKPNSLIGGFKPLTQSFLLPEEELRYPQFHQNGTREDFSTSQ